MASLLAQSPAAALSEARRDSVSTASDATINFDEEMDGDPLWDVYEDGIPLAPLYDAQRRMRWDTRRHKDSDCIWGMDRRGLMIICSVVGGMVLTIILLPWLAASYNITPTPAPPPNSTRAAHTTQSPVPITASAPTRSVLY
ncbi:hypothetical protein MVES1_003659 [Malassezia vespertilionis]|uniref:uncharacterized protein n=1 Tax=Malassezia vespertilionis TaxID=2020962 RepID=UPI0024B20852|nr:uncharacterized protein MVES1_003659 [Malassezia vespertilionis]WFD08287.1 hypothetical protein MVES1_003659 [Malassezia vespertilionis]